MQGTGQDSLYPLTFRPLLKEVVWGGRRLSELGKALPPGPIGESWELVDLASDQSVVETGRFSGKSITELLESHRDALLGPVQTDGGRFPLLVKYIDANQTLSVQVHPDQAVAARLGGRPKSEAWYILAAEPDAKLYLGLKDGVTPTQFEQAIADNTLEALLIVVPAKVGDLVPVRPGTVHAIGGGVMLAEVQQPSNTTYRIYDWGRMGIDGKPRQLHIEETLQSVDYGARPVLGQASYDAGHFQMTIERFDGSGSITPGVNTGANPRGPVVLVGLEGDAEVCAPGCEPVAIARGRTVLVPHCCRPAELRHSAAGKVISVTFPDSAES